MLRRSLKSILRAAHSRTGSDSGREGGGGDRRAPRGAPEPGDHVEDAGAGEYGGGIWGHLGWRRWGGGDSARTREDRRADDGEGFFVRCAREIPRPERQAMIDRGSEVSVKRQAELLDVSRASVYY